MSAPTTHWFLNGQIDHPAELSLGHGKAMVYLSPVEPGGENQDSAAVIALDPQRSIFVVADGMGGGPGGAAASADAVRSVVECVVASEKDGLNLRSGVLDGFEAAQQRVQALAAGAATTLLVVEVVDQTVRTYHAGDSGACVFGRGGVLKLATDFHSPVGYAVKSGLLHEDDALEHQDRHIVSNIIGMPDMSVEVGSPLALARFDTLVMGSDGLFDNLYPRELIESLRRGDLATVTSELQREVATRMTSPEADKPHKPDDLTIISYRRHAG